MARGTFVDIEGVTQPAPQPRFSRTVPDTPGPVQPAGGGGHAALRAWGLAQGTIAAWLADGAVRFAPDAGAQGGGGA